MRVTDLRKCFISIMLGTVAFCAYGQQQVDSLVVYFHQGSSVYDSDYRSNSRSIDSFIEDMESKPEHIKIVHAEYHGSTSPEGSYRLNESLSRQRARAITEMLQARIPFDEDNVETFSVIEDYDGLLKYVEDDLETPDREKVIEILKGEGNRKQLLQSLSGGSAWDYMLEKHFPQLRYCLVIITTEAKPRVSSLHIGIDSQVERTPLPALPAYVPEVEQPISSKKLTLKTNFLGWGLLGSNMAVEYDLVPHLSVAMPVYYSGGFNYFSPTIKFRGLILQPELRYFPSVKNGVNGGFYIGAHLGLGWYNYALDGDYRIQDHRGRRPSYGGGLGMGYNLQFKKNPHWGIEFAVGAGVYSSKYDVFYNGNNGPYYQTGIKKTWFGIDNAAISLTYKFDLKNSKR